MKGAPFSLGSWAVRAELNGWLFRYIDRFLSGFPVARLFAVHGAWGLRENLRGVQGGCRLFLGTAREAVPACGENCQCNSE